MARLNRELVKQRETEALEALATGATIKQVNQALLLKHGKTMALKRLYELRASLTKKDDSDVVVEEEPIATEAVVME